MKGVTSPVGSWRLTRNPFLGTDSGVFYGAAIHSSLCHAETVVDVGCGRGYVADDPHPEPNLFDFRGEERTVIGMDVDPAAAVNPFIDDFRLIRQGEPWPLGDDSCDLVVSDWTLEHVDEPEHFVRELLRVLRPGGLFVARSINSRSILSFISRLVPNADHPSMLRHFQPHRQSYDVFPVRYRMNSQKTLTPLLEGVSEYKVVFFPGISGYLSRWPRVARGAHWLEARAPDRLKTIIVVIARKR